MAGKNNMPRLCNWVHMGKKVTVIVKMKKHHHNVILFYRSFSFLTFESIPKTLQENQMHEMVSGFHNQSVLYG